MTCPSDEHQRLVDATVAWLDGLLDCASVDTIGVSNWWTRATSALQAAATADTIGAAVTTAARKLQIDTLVVPQPVLAAGQVIAAHHAAWQALVETEGVYLVALVRVTRTGRRTTKTTTGSEL